MLEEFRELKKITQTLIDKDIALNQYADEWKCAFNAIPDVIFITNDELEIRYVNKTFLKHFNVSNESIIGKKCYEFIYNITDYSDCICKGEDGLSRCYGEVYNKHSNRWYIYDKAPIKGEKCGDLLGHVNILRDITEEKASKEARLDVEERYRGLFEYINNGVIILESVDNGNNFAINDMNKAAERIENINKKDIIGNNITDVFTGIRSTGILNILKSVLTTGNHEYIFIDMCEDEICREGSIYKLKTGEVIIIYDVVSIKDKIISHNYLCA